MTGRERTGGKGEKGGPLKIEDNSILACGWARPDRVGEMDVAEKRGQMKEQFLATQKGAGFRASWGLWPLIGEQTFTPRQQVCTDFGD